MYSSARSSTCSSTCPQSPRCLRLESLALPARPLAARAKGNSAHVSDPRPHRRRRGLSSDTSGGARRAGEASRRHGAGPCVWPATRPPDDGLHLLYLALALARHRGSAARGTPTRARVIVASTPPDRGTVHTRHGPAALKTHVCMYSLQYTLSCYKCVLSTHLSMLYVGAQFTLMFSVCQVKARLLDAARFKQASCYARAVEPRASDASRSNIESRNKRKNRPKVIRRLSSRRKYSGSPALRRFCDVHLPSLCARPAVVAGWPTGCSQKPCFT